MPAPRLAGVLSFGLVACGAPASPVAQAQQGVAADRAMAAAPLPSRTGFGLIGRMEQGGAVRGTAPAGTTSLLLDDKPVAFAADCRFVIGFDRDQPANAKLVAILRDGSRASETLTVLPRSWRIERVNVSQRPSTATADYLRLRQRELARIAAARSVGVASEGWRQSFISPARGRISGVFGSQRIYRGEPGAYHSGVDVAAGQGSPVVAPADGVVVLAGPPAFSLEGNLVIIDHGLGLNSAFLHLSSSAVREGQTVRQGQLIGTVGATGRATGPHLHWGMKWNDARLDPQMLVEPVTATQAGSR